MESAAAPSVSASAPPLARGAVTVVRSGAARLLGEDGEDAVAGGGEAERTSKHSTAWCDATARPLSDTRVGAGTPFCELPTQPQGNCSECNDCDEWSICSLAIDCSAVRVADARVAGFFQDIRPLTLHKIAFNPPQNSCECGGVRPRNALYTTNNYTLQLRLMVLIESIPCDDAGPRVVAAVVSAEYFSTWEGDAVCRPARVSTLSPRAF